MNSQICWLFWCCIALQSIAWHSMALHDTESPTIVLAKWVGCQLSMKTLTKFGCKVWKILWTQPFSLSQISFSSVSLMNEIFRHSQNLQLPSGQCCCCLWQMVYELASDCLACLKGGYKQSNCLLNLCSQVLNRRDKQTARYECDKKLWA